MHELRPKLLLQPSLILDNCDFKTRDSTSKSAGKTLPAPIPALAPVMMIIFLDWSFVGFLGSMAQYGSRRTDSVIAKGVVYAFGSGVCKKFAVRTVFDAEE